MKIDSISQSRMKRTNSLFSESIHFLHRSVSVAEIPSARAVRDGERESTGNVFQFELFVVV